MMLAAGTHTYHEIKGQPEAWAATYDALERQKDVLRAQLKKEYAQVLFTGCGSTYYLALTGATIWQTLTQHLAQAQPASELWLFSERMRAVPSLLVTLSRSGETTETLRAVETYKAKTHGDCLAITCNAKSPLVSATSMALVAQEAVEQSVAQTRSFACMLLMTQYAAALAANRNDLLKQLAYLPEHGERLMKEYEKLVRSIAYDATFDYFVFLGSGPFYGLASEGMLKMTEMSLSTSQVFHFLEFRHGPKSIIGPRTLIVGLVSDAAFEQEVAVLNEMRELGASVLAITESRRTLQADYVIELNSGLDELARSVLVLPLLQLLAYHRGLSKDLNPDSPAHLNAVVRL